jgi:peptidoglycan/LPS O-acetylase OafA/YrhL
MNSALVFLLQTAPTSHEPQLIDLDQTVFVQLGIFLLLALVLWRLLWRPYLRVREERRWVPAAGVQDGRRRGRAAGEG